MTDPHAEARRYSPNPELHYEFSQSGDDDPQAEAGGLAELQQMCDAPSDAYSAGQWCFAANQLVRIVAELSAREERLREALERIASGDFIRRDSYDIAREALSTSEARAEHLREAREVEAWQEAKHARREEDSP